jgi:F0F1-type ATP synthase membrane subunit c/vacuolar-type H+-ATPase subunit K
MNAIILFIVLTAATNLFAAIKYFVSRDPSVLSIVVLIFALVQTVALETLAVMLYFRIPFVGCGM